MFEKKKSVWLFLLPGLAMLMIFYIVPFFSGIGYSLTDGSYKNTFVGLQNYRDLWQNSMFLLGLKNTMELSLICAPLLWLFSFLLASALLFACHIVVVGHFAPQADGVALSCAQFFVAGLMTLPIAFLTEHIPLAGIWEAKWALLYAGVLSCGVAYTLQIVGQKDTPPAIASLTMSLESVFSAIAGAIILHETLQPREMLGCALMLAAVMIAQLPIGRQKKAA